MTKSLTNLSTSTSLQSSRAFEGQFLYIMISLSRFSTPRRHCHKLVSTPATKKICSVSIYEPVMPKVCHANKPTFGNLDSLATHHSNGSKESTFFTWKLWNQNNSALRRPSIVSWVEIIAPNNSHGDQGCSSGGGSRLVVWLGFKTPIIAFNMGITMKSSYYYTNVSVWSLRM